MSNILKVFNFTFSQLLKRKSNIITFIIMALIMALGLPIATLFLDGTSSGVIEIGSEALTIQEYLDKGAANFETEYAVQYGYSVFLMMVTIIAASYIIRAIVEEKTSKLVETLLVSIKSKDMILGKIFAVMVYVLIWLGALFTIFKSSQFVSGKLFDLGVVDELIKNKGISLDILNLGFETVVVIAVSFVLAYLFFAMLYALAGAGCSSTEDIESASSAGTFSILIGYFATTILLPIGSKGIVYATSLIPIISAFGAPINFIMNKIGWGTLAVSWLIQALMIFLLYKFSVSVYDALILYKGKRLKLGDIIALSERKGK